VTKSRWLRVLALLLGLTMVAAACGDDDDSAGEEDRTTETEPEGADSGAVGGDLVIGAEQEPDCVDWIATCAGSAWGYWMMGATTMPRAFDVVEVDGEWGYEPSTLLDGEPELEEEPQQVVTYRISEDAVWSDGEPITSTDFKYTWEQITTGEDIYDTTGYANIELVDDSDPKVAVVTFAEPYAGWEGLFGGGFGIYPSHVLEGQDRNAAMANGYDFSGGPWMIESWDKGVEVVLVPNENYWGDVPKLDSVTFRFITDTAAQFQAYRAEEVDMIYPQPQLDVVEAISAGIEGKSSYPTETASVEALWFNNAEFPVDSLAVRQAFAFSLDRDAIVESLFGELGLTEASQSLNPAILSQFADEEAFAGYTLDLDQVDELMTGDGWTKNSSGIWEKDGQPADIVATTNSGNARRELTLQVVQEQAREAGFNVSIEVKEAGTLFGQLVPQGEFQLVLVAPTANTLDPLTPNLFLSSNIPTEENGFSGGNWFRVDIPELDPLLETLQNSLDDEQRRKAGVEADQILAENAVAIPLDSLPNILLWSDTIQGPVEDNPLLGPFSQMHRWTVEA